MNIKRQQRVKIVCGPDVRCMDTFNGIVGYVREIHPEGYDNIPIPTALISVCKKCPVAKGVWGDEIKETLAVAIEALQPAPEEPAFEPEPEEDPAPPEEQPRPLVVAKNATDRDIAITSAILAVLQARYPRVQVTDLMSMTDTVVPRENNEEGDAYFRINGFAFAKVVYEDPYTFKIALNPDNDLLLNGEQEIQCK